MPRILLVEDDVNVRALMEQVLLGGGYQIDPVPTAAQARMLLAGGGYDLVLTDGLLPDGTGIHIADEAERQGIRAMIVTAYAFQFPKRDLCPIRAAVEAGPAGRASGGRAQRAETV